MNDSHTGPPLVLASGPDDGVAVLTLNRPEKKNALSIALREEAIAILGRLAGDEAVKALIVTGSGGCFSTGFDLREFAVTDPGHQERLWLSSDQFHHAVHRFPVPVIAAVDGDRLRRRVRPCRPVRPARRHATRGFRPSRGRPWSGRLRAAARPGRRRHRSRTGPDRPRGRRRRGAAAAPRHRGHRPWRAHGTGSGPGPAGLPGAEGSPAAEQGEVHVPFSHLTRDANTRPVITASQPRAALARPGTASGHAVPADHHRDAAVTV